MIHAHSVLSGSGMWAVSLSPAETFCRLKVEGCDITVLYRSKANKKVIIGKLCLN